MKITKLNNEKVVAVPLVGLGKVDTKPVKGFNILPEIYCNCFVLAKKKMGKSTLIYKMIKDTIDPRTKVYAFVSTLNKDKIWKTIRHYCESHNIEFNGYTSIIDNGVNILGNLVNRLQQPDEEEEVKKVKKQIAIQCNDDDDDDEKKPRKKKYKYRVPDYIFILDDLSTELKDPAVIALMKTHRHYDSKVYIGNQYWNDCAKSGRKMTDYMIIFGKQPVDKLIEVHKELDLDIAFDEFMEMYKFAIKEKFNFLYIDINNCEYRKNFNLKLHQRETD